MKTGKRLLAAVLVVLMVVTCAPLAGFVGLEFGTKAAAANYKVGDHIQFGNYPQSQVTDSALIKKLDSVKKIWKSYGYYSGTGEMRDGNMEPADYMGYADFYYNSNRYRAVFFSAYRKAHTGYIANTVSEYYGDIQQNSNGYYYNNIYYFRYEPLSWRVLNPNTGLILCEKAIDAQAFNNTVYDPNPWGASDLYQDESMSVFASDYALSSIRHWLNATFLNTAFSSSQVEQIKQTKLNNECSKHWGDIYDSAQTVDKIFLLSISDIKNSRYGFNSDGDYHDSNRIVLCTEYAKCQGIEQWYNKAGCWILRTPNSSGDVCAVSYDGDIYEGYGGIWTDETYAGIRPACCLKTIKNDTSVEDSIKVSTPTGLKITATNTTALNLTWNKVSGTTGYVVYQYNPSTKKYTKLGSAKTNAYKAKNLQPGTTYQFAVRAYKTVSGKNYYSGYSAILKASTTAAKSFSFKNSDTSFILQHVSFITNTLYKDSVKKDLRFAKTLWNTYHNGGGKAAAEFAYDVMEGVFQTITLDFDYKAVENPYDLILLKLLADNSQIESNKESFEEALINTYSKYFDKLLTLTQSEEKWSESDIKGALEDMITFQEKDLDGNKIIQFFKTHFKNQNVSELMETVFGKLSYFADVADALRKVSTGAQYIIDVFKTVSAIEAYKSSSAEFKSVLQKVKSEMTSVDDTHGKNFLKAYNMITTDDVSRVVSAMVARKALIFGANMFDDVAKEGIKGFLKAKGMADAAISKLSAWLFAYELGFMIGNMVTGNDKAVACRRTMRAYYILESAVFHVLNDLQIELVKNQNITNAKVFDEAFNLFKKIQINFLDAHREFCKNTKKNIALNWTSASDNAESQIDITNRYKSLWKKIVCHFDDAEFSFAVDNGTFSGEVVKPTVTVRYGYITLKNGKDFKVNYKNNTAIGKSATATITGTGNYQGSKDIAFSILPKKVSGLKATAADKTSLSLKWSKVVGATGYVVYRYNTSTKEYTKVGATKTNTYKVTGLKAGKTYRFAARAYRKVDGKNIYGSYSAVLKATTKK